MSDEFVLLTMYHMNSEDKNLVDKGGSRGTRFSCMISETLVSVARPDLKKL